MQSQQTEKAAEQIAVMGRTDIIKMIQGFTCDFQLDFSDDFLNSISIERLRHIALAASLHSRNMPTA